MIATSPLPRLVESEVQKAQAADVIRVACDLLIEVRNYGSNAFGRCEASISSRNLRPPEDTSVERDEHWAVGMLYRHLLELVDGLEPLVRECATLPGQIVARSIFEALLQLEWMLENDTLRRAHAYLTAHLRKRLRRMRAFDPTTPEGQELQRTKERDRHGKDAPVPVVPNIAEAIERRMRVLQKPFYKEADAALRAVRRTSKRWFSVYDGPRNYEELAERLGRGFEYWLLYGGWSATAHGEDAVRHTLPGPSVTAFRDPGDLHIIANLAVAFTCDATKRMLEFYRPEDLGGFSNWFQENVQPGYHRLATLQTMRVT